MRTIWKWPLPYDVDFTLDMPKGAQILTAETQYAGSPRLEAMTMWALVDPEAPTEPRRFRLGGTGGPLPDDPGQHVGTCQLNGGDLVFHVFEVV